MKAIVFRLSQGSDKQFEIGENADKNVIGYFAEMYAGWNSWEVEETESSIEAGECLPAKRPAWHLCTGV